MSKKKRKTEKKKLRKDVRKVFTDNPKKSFNYKQVSSSLNIHDKSKRKLVSDILQDEAEKGILTHHKKG
ncbi:MAG: hypothetical protein ABEH43_01190, partial [Flavobacteriales bacterium]